jgi:hypothetical protein
MFGGYLRNLSWRRLYCRIVRQEGSPESVARGLAIGLFVGFAMPMGGQLVVAIPLAFILKGNKVLAALGTVVTNPYTSLVIYPIQCWIGALLLGSPLDFHFLEERFKSLLAQPSWDALKGLGVDLLVPFLVGGLLLAVLTCVPTYYLTLRTVRAYRARKLIKKRMRRLLRLRKMKAAAAPPPK